MIISVIMPAMKPRIPTLIRISARNAIMSMSRKLMAITSSFVGRVDDPAAEVADLGSEIAAGSSGYAGFWLRILLPELH